MIARLDAGYPRADFLDDPAERAWLVALKPEDVLANAHRWYGWVAETTTEPGLGDSLIRELAFEKASQALGIDYDVLYDAWLNETPAKVTA